MSHLADISRRTACTTRRLPNLLSEIWTARQFDVEIIPRSDFGYTWPHHSFCFAELCRGARDHEGSKIADECANAHACRLKSRNHAFAAVWRRINASRPLLASRSGIAPPYWSSGREPLLARAGLRGSILILTGTPMRFRTPGSRESGSDHFDLGSGRGGNCCIAEIYGWAVWAFMGNRFE